MQVSTIAKYSYLHESSSSSSSSSLIWSNGAHKMKHYQQGFTISWATADWNAVYWSSNARAKGQWNRDAASRHSIAPVNGTTPAFNLSRRLWSTLNRFRTGQSRCAANLVRWHQVSDPSCMQYVKTLDRQWIIASITVQSHDFLVVCGPYIKLTKTPFHD